MTVSPTRTSSRPRVVVTTLVSAALGSAVATGLLGLGALLAGAGDAFPPLQPAVAMPFAAVGTLVGIGGWVLVVRFVKRAAATLRWLVPLAVVVSWVPDVALLVSGFVPGSSPTAVVALMLMHVAAAVSAVVAGQRIAPAT